MIISGTVTSFMFFYDLSTTAAHVFLNRPFEIAPFGEKKQCTHIVYEISIFSEMMIDINLVTSSLELIDIP